jgi:NAD(P)-dependent dehydrogenase (short-subunit alcohol dehydrogenase family)
MKVAIVAGGTKGLGAALSLELGRNGYFVLAVFRKDQLAAQRLRDALISQGSQGAVFAHDLSGDGLVDVLESYPELQAATDLVLVNSAAGPFTPTPLHLARWSAFEAQLNQTARCAIEATLAVLPRMVRARRGTIVSVLTEALATDPPPKGFATYLAAKAAARAVTRSVAAEYGSRGVRSFSVSPGPMRTPFTDSWDERIRDAVFAAAGHVDDVDDVAKWIVALIERPDVRGGGEDHRYTARSPSKQVK